MPNVHTYRRVAIAVALATLAATSLHAQTAGRIHGRVTDHRNARPLQDVAVRLSGTELLTETDRQGRFLLDAVPPGEFDIIAERLGYETRSVTVKLDEGGILDVTLVLSARAIELPPIIVEGRSRWLTNQGFYDRRDNNVSGTFITRADFEHRGPTNLQDILKNVRSVRFNHVEAGSTNIRFNRMTTDRLGPAMDPSTPAPVFPGCEPDIYLDGQRYRERTTRDPSRPWESLVNNINFIPPDQIEALEVYVGNPPTRFMHPCGVLLIWTRRGG
jgi:hypothetical protein